MIGSLYRGNDGLSTLRLEVEAEPDAIGNYCFKSLQLYVETEHGAERLSISQADAVRIWESLPDDHREKALEQAAWEAQVA